MHFINKNVDILWMNYIHEIQTRMANFTEQNKCNKEVIIYIFFALGNFYFFYF